MCMLNGKLLGEAFPINKIEVFFDNLDHSNFLGFTWERVGAGKFPVGLDTSDTDFDTIGETGGEKTHTLTTQEMPSHSHTLMSRAVSGNNYNYAKVNTSGPTTNEQWKTGESLSTGGGQAHNNLPPYVVMAFWKRTA